MILNFIQLESLLSNASFLLLFISTIYYWIKIIFYSKTAYYFFGLTTLGLTSFFLTIELILRWVDSGHFPLSNLYESLIFLSWFLVVIYIFLEIQTKIDFLGIIICPAVLGLIAFAGLVLPPELQQSRPLVPALQSNWLFMHVSVMIASYALLLLGSVLGILYIIFSFSFQLNKSKVLPIKETVSTRISTSLETSLTLKQVSIENKENFLDFLDNLSYRSIGIGFCFLTLGILSGAVWANETWGSYWSWDPKETWALITWLTFAIYLHTRLIRGWQGFKPAFIASFGLVILWICYLGVNLLGKGLHTYGFLNG
jgi:cytochrome c-type biogenesis protein CcsB